MMHLFYYVEIVLVMLLSGGTSNNINLPSDSEQEIETTSDGGALITCPPVCPKPKEKNPVKQ